MSQIRPELVNFERKATLKHLKSSNCAYIFLNVPKLQIYSSGFPKKVSQGCHISEGARRIIFIFMALNALGSKSMETNVKSVANQTQGFFLSRHFVSSHALTMPLSNNNLSPPACTRQGRANLRLGWGTPKHQTYIKQMSSLYSIEVDHFQANILIS